MNSVSTYANSSASLIWQDLLSEMRFFKGYSDQMATRMLKVISAVIGVSAIGFGMLVKHLGSIVVVTNSFSNAIGAARTGIFIVGMFAPWVSAKGAYAGFVTAFVFNMWLMIGQFITGLGQPEMLSLSTEGCPESLHQLNSTSVLLLDSTLENQTFSPKMFEYEPHEEVRLSTPSLLPPYTPYHVTGPLRPRAVDPQLIDPRCLKLYNRLWGLFNKSVHSDNFDFTDTKADSGPSTTSSTRL
ncbi:sodium-dependent multivitamin transporter-like [Macrobrachium rosenbergii]|uniref:sodium-dependent multivitamin transporter-like n=1 Tax=Macrobrachium rosenbergii TaxID=79674 RepID=UPI0034D4048D